VRDTHGITTIETPKHFINRSMRGCKDDADENSICVRGGKNNVLVEGTPQQKESIEAVMTNCFTQEELKAMIREGDLIISVEPLPFGIAGVYDGKENGSSYKIHINTLCLDDGDTLLHELIHHSRMVDKSRESILLRSRSISDTVPEFNYDDRSLEDAATTLESLARQSDYVEPFIPGYYSTKSVSKGRDPFDIIRKDRELVTGSAAPGSRGFKGIAARNVVEATFNDSEIKDLIISEFSDISAKDRLDELKRLMR